MEHLSKLMPDVAPEVPGCPNMMALSALRMSARDFLRQTHVWRETLEPMEPGQDEPSIHILPALPSGASMLAIVSVTPVGGHRKIRASLEPPDKLTVYDAYGERFEVTRALNLESGENKLPGWLLERVGEHIACGAKYRLLRMPNKEWTDPDLAAHYNGLFRDGIGQMRIEQASGFSHGGNNRIYPRSFT
ncbi:MAG: hypothetical protein LAT50_12125 [Ectothiorhodospiraceae bacterium]|nr:hypothetical protein [Ectothiorhodospiraceae bacterium]